MKDILTMIHRNLTRTYFREARLDAFFESCFALKRPHILMEDPKF